jgi:hypothetical protein
MGSLLSMTDVEIRVRLDLRLSGQSKELREPIDVPASGAPVSRRTHG